MSFLVVRPCPIYDSDATRYIPRRTGLKVLVYTAAVAVFSSVRCGQLQGPSMMSYLTFGAADLGCLSQLFFQNTSSLLGVLIAIFNMTAFGVPIDVITTVSTTLCMSYATWLDNVLCKQQCIMLTPLSHPYTAEVFKRLR